MVKYNYNLLIGNAFSKIKSNKKRETFRSGLDLPKGHYGVNGKGLAQANPKSPT
jgi:hypothetical protein